MKNITRSTRCWLIIIGEIGSLAWFSVAFFDVLGFASDSNRFNIWLAHLMLVSLVAGFVCFQGLLEGVLHCIAIKRFDARLSPLCTWVSLVSLLGGVALVFSGCGR